MTKPDISQDQLRRDLETSQAQHNAAMPAAREVVERVVGDEQLDADQRATLLLGWNRRNVLRFGGALVVAGAVLAACGDDDSTATTGGTTATTAGATTTAMSDTTPAGTGDFTPSPANDLVLLRTASSLEVLAVAAYQTAIDSGLVTTAAVGEAAMLFQSQHEEHAALFQGATTAAGGEAYTEPNAVVLDALQPTIDGLSDERGVVQLAYDLEVAAAQTYQFAVAKVSDGSLNKALMSVGGVEARHAAILGAVLATMIPPAAFQGIDQAVPSAAFVA